MEISTWWNSEDVIDFSVEVGGEGDMVDWKVMLDAGQSGGRAGLGSKVNCASRVFQEVSGWSQNLHCWSWMERKAIWVELECGHPVLVEMALV